MEEMVVQRRKDGKRLWTVEQKLHILEEYASGAPGAEICRKYNIDRQALYQWKRRLSSSGKGMLQREGEIVPRSMYLTALRRIEELERALGRKTLENDILKKSRIEGIKITRRDIKVLSGMCHCSLRTVCRAFGKSQGWYFYRHRHRNKHPLILRPEIVPAIQGVMLDRPVTYGYRRIHALVREQRIDCNPKTIHRYMRLKLWLSTHRQKRISNRHREGKAAVAVPNKRWASDITGIKSWNGQKGRFAIVIDCGDRQILGYRWAHHITGEDIGAIVTDALKKRFDTGVPPQNGSIEFLSDNGPEYRKRRLRSYLEQAGFTVCNTPIRSPESNGIAEAFFKSFKRDYVYQNTCETFLEIGGKIPLWIEDYNTRASHSALGILTPVKFYEKWVSGI